MNAHAPILAPLGRSLEAYADAIGGAQ